MARASPMKTQLARHAARGYTEGLAGKIAALAFCTLLIASGVGCDSIGPRIYRVPTGAMLPTIKVGQRVLVMRLPAGTTNVERGDIIVFHDLDEPDKLWIKRVIGLAED